MDSQKKWFLNQKMDSQKMVSQSKYGKLYIKKISGDKVRLHPPEKQISENMNRIPLYGSRLDAGVAARIRIWTSLRSRDVQRRIRGDGNAVAL